MGVDESGESVFRIDALCFPSGSLQSSVSLLNPCAVVTVRNRLPTLLNCLARRGRKVLRLPAPMPQSHELTTAFKQSTIW